MNDRFLVRFLGNFFFSILLLGCVSLDNSIESFCTGRSRSKKSGERKGGGRRNVYLNEGSEWEGQEVAHEMNPVYFRSCHYPTSGT